MEYGKGPHAKCPRPKEILDLSFLNTSDEMVKKAHDNWALNYEQASIVRTVLYTFILYCS